jgi:hypothetical protein
LHHIKSDAEKFKQRCEKYEEDFQKKTENGEKLN